jgi:hypothetical protein
MGGRSKWTSPLSADGSYRVKLTGTERDDQVCIRAEPSGLNGLESAEPGSSVLLKCATFLQGLQRLDIENVHLPLGIIRVDIPPVDGAAPDLFADLTVSIIGIPGSRILRGFKVLRGFRGEYFSDFREQEFTVASKDRKTVFASSRITLSAEQPVRLVTLVTTRR